MTDLPSRADRLPRTLADLVSTDPSTSTEFARYPQLDEPGLDARLVLAATAFGPWSESSSPDRARVLRAAASALRSGAPQWAELMASEMGKPVREGLLEANKCAWACEHYAEHAEGYLLDEPVEVPGASALVRYEPVGPVLGVMPWNFPFWQVIRCAAPALMAGNVVLLKPASNVAGCGLALEELFRTAGAPAGVFQTLLLDSSRVAELIRDPRVRMVTLTGSFAAGSEVARAAGSVSKKAILELGGSDPFIVLSDADVEAAAQAGVSARFSNAGQSCIAAKRFIVVEEALPQFLSRFEEGVRRLVVGDPRDPKTEVGPLAKEELRTELERQIGGSVDAGARIRLGGVRSSRSGFFFPPTVVEGVVPGMPLFDEEVFGPVAAISVAQDDPAALVLANQSRFGLGASLWTRNLGRARELARQIRAGMVFVNGLVRSDPRVPFGGVKDSGFGRELGRHGIRELTTAQLVWLEEEDRLPATASAGARAGPGRTASL
ncbi:MAG: NAD-dependent succinate-semialdehyde dehydrogenase [Thermoplasmata archaeon]|nr:NAD-dependent succinate-semialdehyde dehydrogenase [Thermoplasmata archaeon]